MRLIVNNSIIYSIISLLGIGCTGVFTNDFEAISEDIVKQTVLLDPFLVQSERTNLVDQTEESIENWLANASRAHENLQGVSKDLKEDETVKHQTLSIYLKKSLERDSFKFHRYPITQVYGSHIDALNFALTVPLNSKKDAENYLTFLTGIELEFGKLIDALEHRRALGMVAPSFVLERVILQCDELASDSIRSSPFYTKFENSIVEIGLMDPKTKVNFLKECETVVGQNVLTCYKRLTAYLRQLEQTSLSVAGVWQLKNGMDFHQHLLHYYSGSKTEVDKLYELGKLNLSVIEGEVAVLNGIEPDAIPNSPIEPANLLHSNGIPMPAYSFGLALFKKQELLNESSNLKPTEKINFLIRDQLATAKLLTDIGIHSKQWLRDQAIEFLERNSVLNAESSTELVDEIIAMPGWHASDKIGFMRLVELQETHPATNVLSLVEELGTVPLEVLELHLSNEEAVSYQD